MNCSHCGRALGDGASRCDGCGVPVVDSSSKSSGPDQELVELFRTTDASLLIVIKSVLDAAGIPYLVQGEEGSRMIALRFAGGFFNSDAYGAVIRVRRADLPDARALLDAGGSQHEA